MEKPSQFGPALLFSLGVPFLTPSSLNKKVIFLNSSHFGAISNKIKQA
jgi:hypothetical protein